MNRIAHLGFWLGLLTLTQLTQVQASNLLINGSFEDGDYRTAGYQRLTAGDTRLTGWVIGPVAVDWHVGTNDPGKNPFLTGAQFGPAQDGSLVIDLNLDGATSGSIEQTFATTAGTPYELSFYMAAVDWFSNPRLVRVDVGGVSQVFSQVASPSTALNWGLKTLAFTAVGDSTTLRFSSPDPSGFWGPLIDNVKVVQVPEPSSLVSLGAGLGLIMGLRRISNRRVSRKID